MLNQLDDLWGRLDAHLQTRLRPALYARWFAPLRPYALEAGMLQVTAPDAFHRDFVDENFRHWFDELLPHIDGTAQRVVFVVDDPVRAGHAEDSPRHREAVPF